MSLHHSRSCREVRYDQEQYLCHRKGEQPHKGESRCTELIVKEELDRIMKQTGTIWGLQAPIMPNNK